MNKRPPLHPDLELEPSIALLVRSMRTALGPADDEEIDEAPAVTPNSEAASDASVPASGVVRIPTVVRTNRSTTESGTASSTPSAVQVTRGGHHSVPPISDSYVIPADTDSPLLSGVLRRTRHRSPTLNDADSGRNYTPVISMAAPGDPLQWDDLHEHVADNEVEAFLQRAGSADSGHQPADAVTEAPTPFAPDAYTDWSEKNSRGE